MWLTFLILAAVLGIVIGYGVSSVVLAFLNEWRWTFYIQAIAVIPPVIAYLSYPIKYLNI